jgi:hypothetical protein
MVAMPGVGGVSKANNDDTMPPVRIRIRGTGRVMGKNVRGAVHQNRLGATTGD